MACSSILRGIPEDWSAKPDRSPERTLVAVIKIVVNKQRCQNGGAVGE